MGGFPPEIEWYTGPGAAPPSEDLHNGQFKTHNELFAVLTPGVEKRPVGKEDGKQNRDDFVLSGTFRNRWPRVGQMQRLASAMDTDLGHVMMLLTTLPAVDFLARIHRYGCIRVHDAVLQRFVNGGFVAETWISASRYRL